MDVEKTMEFLLEGQARHESQIQVIRNLLEDWMKLVVSYQTKTDETLSALMNAQLRTEASLERLAAAQASTDLKLDRLAVNLARLADAQAITELKLQTFLDSMKSPKNGN